ncbi:VOC family protein [Fluviispira sanaruensis]|uniref:VOC family protein n=1 Tax=Fluviispira sanaruensis TaxID=2493639 RepID=A0A4P2VLG8_FLUSA|nr:VOC family protein [Fluviispira sanaruensis]BBH53701.1 VOC family protein [Fluviispira sanaruensis]
MSFNTPWIKGIGHLAIIIDDLEKGKWFFGEVLQSSFYMYKGEQIMVEMGSSVFVAKLSKDAVDKTRQVGQFGKQVLDHYGFQAESPSQVDAFCQRMQSFQLEIVREPHDRSDGRAFYFRDPFGNLVEYFWYNRKKDHE